MVSEFPWRVGNCFYCQRHRPVTIPIIAVVHGNSFSQIVSAGAKKNSDCLWFGRILLRIHSRFSDGSVDARIIHGDTWIELIVFLPGFGNIVSLFPLVSARKQKKYGKEAIPRDVKKILGKRAMFSLRSDLPCRAFHTIASMSILAR